MSALSTADVLTAITHIIRDALGYKHSLRNIALDILKTFDNVWQNGLLHNVFSYGITGQVFSIRKSFLLGRSLKVVVNDKSFEALDVNAGVPQGSLFGPTLI